MTPVLAVESHTPYDVLVGLHVVAAVVGFGAVALSGVYGGAATRPGRDGAMEELRRYFASPGRAELLVTVVPVPGVAALVVAPGPTRLGQLWVALGLVLWVVAGALLLGVVRPAEAAIRRGVGPVAGTARPDPGDLPPDGPTTDVLRRAGSRLRWAAAATDLVFVLALVLMVIQPGS